MPHLFASLTFGLHCLIQTLSSWATSSVEEVASTGNGIRFFQLYVSMDVVSMFVDIVV